MQVWRVDVGVATWRYGALKHRRRAAGVRAWRYGGMELWRCAAYLQKSKHGGIERRRHAAGVLTLRYKGMEVWRLDVGIATWRTEIRRVGVKPQARMCGGMELGSSGGALHSCTRSTEAASSYAWRYGARELRCMRADDEIERRRHAAGV